MSALLLGEEDDEGLCRSTVPISMSALVFRRTLYFSTRMPYISKQKSEGFDVHAPPWRDDDEGLCRTSRL